MDVKHINPFVESFCSVMPQLGFSNASIGKLSAKHKIVSHSGFLIILGVVGDFKGNVVYTLELADAKAIASVMMMGMPVVELDDIAKSALSELGNMLTAHAATKLSEAGTTIEISPPTLLHGENMRVDMNSNQILCVRLLADSLAMDVNIAFE